MYLWLATIWGLSIWSSCWMLKAARLILYGENDTFDALTVSLIIILGPGALFSSTLCLMDAIEMLQDDEMANKLRQRKENKS